MRLRLVVPGRGRRAGLGGLAAAVALLLLAGCGGGQGSARSAAPAGAARPVVLATGLTEANAQLLWPSGARDGLAPAFARWRSLVAALRPAYVRVLVNWAALQPDPASAPAFGAAADGCLRGAPPCGAYAGLREELQAIAAMQRARGDGGPQVEVVPLGVPGWAARPPSGCERSDAGPASRPITPTGLLGYRALLRSLVALARQTGAQVRWWAPWNEPNHPAFVSPQRAACSTASPALAPGVYAELVRVARATLAAAPGDQRLVLGELSGTVTGTPRRAGIAEFVAGLPDDVACAGAVWSVHEYARPVAQPGDGDPVAALEHALDARPCTRGAHVWVTETGVGGEQPGAPRPNDDASLRAGCRAQDVLLRRWAADPRVDAAFQYTFRDDTAYPVGLADPGLTRTYPTYDLWRAWGARAPANPPPPLPASCA